MVQLASVLAPSRTHEAYLEIKRRILQLDLLPGATFSEGDLATEMGLSRTLVREALGWLRQDGFVVVVARSGYTVKAVTLKDARDLFHVRSLLEGSSAALAAERAVDVDVLVELERGCPSTYDRDEPLSIVALLDSNTELHLELARLGGNAVLASMLEHVLERLQRMFHLALVNAPRATEMVHDHHELFSAVRERDPERALAVASAHAMTSERMVIEALLSSDAVQSINLGATVPADRDGWRGTR
jgi:DNA-binding GntR family transcriptional regulator